MEALRPLEWAVAAAPIAGESVCGDLHVVASFEGGTVLAVIDGLGHGEEAATASRLAAAQLAADPAHPVAELFKRCHEQLRKTRGAAISIASCDWRARTLSWAGVGNVEGTLLRADRATRPAKESVPMRGGVVGYQLPPIHARTHPLLDGDLLIFATDGVGVAFADAPVPPGSPQEVADLLLARHRKPTDDALILVGRYRAGRAA